MVTDYPLSSPNEKIGTKGVKPHTATVQFECGHKPGLNLNALYNFLVENLTTAPWSECL